jgi:subtilase family serine protease
MTKRTWLGPAVLLSGFGLLSACSTPASPTQQPAPAATNGSRPSWAQASAQIGRVGSSDPINVQVHLQLKDLARAQAELAEISDPDNARYGQWLSDEEFAAEYGPSDADLTAVKAHLEQFGLVVDYVPGNRTFIQAHGTAQQIEAAFSTQLGLFKVGDQVKRAPISDVVMPTQLAGKVSAVLGLSSPVLYAPHLKRGAIPHAQAVAMVMAKNPHAHPNATAGAPACSEWFGQIADTVDPAYPGYSALTYAPCGYKPAHLRAAYGLSDTIRKGNDGKGQKIAIVDAFLSPTLLKDAQTYAANNDPDYPLKASQLQTMWAPGQTQDPDTGWYGEQTLDVEAAHAMAPGATLVAVAAQSAYDQDLIAAVNMVIDQHLGSVISNSYGMVEQGSYTDFLAWKAVFAQAGLKGIGVYFSSGDSGDNSVGFFGDQPPSADFPSSSDLVTSVGGTSLALGQTGDMVWELGWETGAAFLTPAAPATDTTPATPATWDPTSGPGYYIFGAGGGYSVIYEQPKWQKGVVPDSTAIVANVPRRLTPDVGMLADPITGFIIGQSSPDGTNYSEGAIGGTSLACPLFAATMTLAQQHAKKTFGFANPLLYKKSKSGAFRDIVPNNVPQAVALPLSDGSVAAVTFDYPSLTIKTGAGWDSVTGLGAPNGKSFIDNIK